VVEKAFKYHAEPENKMTAKRAWQHIQTCREVYNHALTQEYKPAPHYNKPSYNSMQKQIAKMERQVERLEQRVLQMLANGSSTY